MAKIIQFYIPKGFHKIESRSGYEKRGQLIEFAPRRKKTA